MMRLMQMILCLHYLCFNETEICRTKAEIAFMSFFMDLLLCFVHAKEQFDDLCLFTVLHPYHESLGKTLCQKSSKSGIKGGMHCSRPLTLHT